MTQLCSEEQRMNDLEDAFPRKAGKIFAAARQKSLDAGISVVESVGGVTSITAPDGVVQPYSPDIPRHPSGQSGVI